MFAKLVAVVLALGAIGCALLALRQSRLQVASELTQTQLRINSADERLWLLRARIAEQITPEQIERMTLEIGPLHPVIQPSRRADKPVLSVNPITPPRMASSEPPR